MMASLLQIHRGKNIRSWLTSRISRVQISGLALTLLSLALAVATRCEAADLFPFVIPWDDAAANATSLADQLAKPAGASGPVVVRQGHLSAGNERWRICGVNLCFAANFPERDVAQKLAARLAKLGINCVRFHHLDMSAEPKGIFVKENGRPAADWRLDPDQLRRLDGLIAELKAVGIYANLNLHVSRRYAPEWRGGPSFGKGLDQFDPTLIELQKQYARALLTHVNSETGNSYATEPAVAIVEINNENALSHEWEAALLDDAPETYQASLSGLWTQFLGKRYKTTKALSAAWNKEATPLGSELVRNGEFAADREAWALEQRAEAKAWMKVLQGADGKRALQIQVQQTGGSSADVQLVQTGFAVKAGQPYRVRLTGRSVTGSQNLKMFLSENRQSGQPLAEARVRVSGQMQTIERVLVPHASDERARLVISGLGDTLGHIEISEVSLRSGGLSGLPADAGLSENETVPWIKQHDWTSRTAAVQKDWIDFLWETERAYWSEMRRFVKEDLGSQALVLGTQLGWSPFPIQAEFDLIDTHAYWQYPEYPSGERDAKNWRVKPLAMSDTKDGAVLTRLARQRVAGKPLICTEYSHPAPNPYASEAYPIAFAQAGQQDWDGIFAFAYSHRAIPDGNENKNRFFDIEQNPVQLVNWTAGVLAFRDGKIAAKPPAVRKVSIAELKRFQQQWGSKDPLSNDDGQAMRRAIAVAVGPQTQPAPIDPNPRPALQWQPGDVQLHAPRAHFWIGRFDEKTVTGPDYQVTFGKTRLGWSAVTLNVLEGDKLSSAKRLLITATGDYVNTGQQWTSPERDSVGESWGQAPTLVEGIPAEFTLPYPAARVKVFALDGAGERMNQVPVAVGSLKGPSRAAKFRIDPAERTLWYEVVIGK